MVQKRQQGMLTRGLPEGQGSALSFHLGGGKSVGGGIAPTCEVRAMGCCVVFAVLVSRSTAKDRPNLLLRRVSRLESYGRTSH